MVSAAQGLAARGHDVELAAKPGSALRERAIEAGLATHGVGFRSDADVGSFLAIYRLCRRFRPDALILNMDRVLRVAGPAARMAGVPVVLPRRGSEFPLKNGVHYRFTYQRIATGMIVNSRATAETLVREIAWRPAGTVHIIPNGLDLARFDSPRARGEVRAELGVAPDTLLMVVLGELTSRKNASLLIERMPELLAAAPMELALIGEGAERERWESLARTRGVEGRVRFLGFRRDVPDLLGAADLLVHPARVEGFGYAVAEAMAAGLPVVATDASSLPEIVVPGETGLLFPPEDGDALVEAILTYARDPERRSADGHRGRARAEREFSLARRLDDLELILREETGDGR